MSQSALFIGNEALVIQCAEAWRARGHSVAALITRSPDIRRWAEGEGIAVLAQDGTEAMAAPAVDWLFSIANLHILADALLAKAARGAINFHDGPLPRRAGLNAPLWALMAGDGTHGVTWHLIEGGIDEGDILAQRLFELRGDETALTLNTRCFEAAIESFGDVIAGIESGAPRRTPQDLSERSYHARADRPRAGALIDTGAPATEILRLVRALDHGSYWNPLALPKIRVGERVLAVGRADGVTLSGPPAGGPGTVLGTEGGLTVACGDGAVRLMDLRDLASGAAVTAAELSGAALPLDPAEAARIEAALAVTAPAEGRHRATLATLDPAELPLAEAATETGATLPLDTAAAPEALVAALGHLADGLAGRPVDLAFAGGADWPARLFSDWVPFRPARDGDLAATAKKLDQARKVPAFALDLPLRDAAITAARPAIGISEGGRVPGTRLTLALTDGGAELCHDTGLSAEAAALLAARLVHIAAALGTGAAVPAMPEAERTLLLETWNETAKDHDRGLTMASAFAAQVAKTPDAPALTHEATTLSYAALDAAANQAAHVLRQMGVKPGVLVALAARRTPLLVIGALAIQKAGGAYVPLDPAYPAERTRLCLEDSGAPVIVTEAAVGPELPPHSAQVLELDTDPRLKAQPETAPEAAAGPEDLAYMIYTSGSTGRPKGVMLEHRNVVNFYAGMDDRIPHDPPGVWLAVTSLSFDISVLELFWTLARGFHVVLMSDADRAMVSGGPAISEQGMEFSLFYWGNDDGAGPKKYGLLLDGARFADQHGFCAVWTPERHFHAFGGPYPNPSVTGAAVAGVTERIGVRAGSCVAPLHHPARIAEDWAVIDNLTNGRAGLAFASGWQPDDFVLRPENTPPKNRQAMLDSIDTVRRLWRGEAVPFPRGDGSPHAVVTQPRPVSKELAVWVTTAGNPQTWKDAGLQGANVLTHLLGQSIAEVADKIKIYHTALREAGHDPADFTVTLMLHTYLAADRETARETAREPMKDYLRAAAGLIKQYAWAFPAFKKPAGVEKPMDIDLGSLDQEELEAILDFAFLRYFEDSGLFGTVEDAVTRVEELKQIGVDEVACLIDYGIAPEVVLAGLKPLAEVLRITNSGGGVAEDDFSLAAQLRRHRVTHLQCTPSMARMLVLNDESRTALRGLKEVMIGGEALPGALVSDIEAATGARIQNMYGPTETTIWSTTAAATADRAVVDLGTPIANTTLYVLDDAHQPVPIGAAGELWIGGEGVARGYWQREELTAERFRPNPFGPGRIYGTGDLVRRRADGGFDFLGRADHQVKIRGYRIELGEIEAAAEAEPGVTQAVVIAREEVAGDPRLIAYVTATPAFSAEALKAALAAQLPPHMVPSAIVALDAMPLTPNGKVDRKALPAPTEIAKAAPTAYEAPETGVAATIAGIWSKILGVPQVGARDNFFELGGHSLLAVQAHREIKAALEGAKLSITDIFRFPTLEGLSAHLDTDPKSPEPAEAGPAASDRAAARAEAMAKRRALRAGRRG